MLDSPRSPSILLNMVVEKIKELNVFLVEWKLTVKADFFRYQTATTALCSFRFWVEWLWFQLPSTTWWREKILSFFLYKMALPVGVDKNAHAYWRHLKKRNFFSRHQVALESWNYNHSTQYRKLHQAVSGFRKNHSLQFVFILSFVYCWLRIRWTCCK